jgi:hypothetical protein
MKLRAQIEGLAVPATIALVPARDVTVAITGNRTRTRTNRGRNVLKARNSYSNGSFAIVYQSCLF